MSFTAQTEIHQTSLGGSRKMNTSTVADIELLVAKAECLLALGQYHAALRDFNLALEIDKNDARIFASRAVLYIRTGDYSKPLRT